MKIAKIETLHCDAGWRPWSFIKISTDEGITGYSECTDSHGSPMGISAVVSDFEKILLGKDPRPVERHFWDMYNATRQSPGSIIQKAIGGIENALLDIKAKALGIPVYELFGGPVRETVRVYWSHCGTTRARSWKVVGKNPLSTLADIEAMGKEVVDRGFDALKTNIIIPGNPPSVHMPGFGLGPNAMDLIQTVGLQAEICKTEAQVLWGKLVRLCALACTTAASGKPIGFIRSDALWRENLLGALKEAAAVAEKEGIHTDLRSHMEKMDSMPYDLSTSMARDVASGNRGETDAIAEAVLRLGNSYGLQCPVIQSMVNIIDSKVKKG